MDVKFDKPNKGFTGKKRMGQNCTGLSDTVLGETKLNVRFI